jgi:DNA primase
MVMGNARKTAVLERLNFAAVISELFPVIEVERGDQVKVNCCFHEDITPSLSINTAMGLSGRTRTQLGN